MSPAGEVQALCLLGTSQHDTVVADFHLDNVLDAIFLAPVEFGLLDTTGGVGDVRVLLANTGAEQLHAATGTGGFDDRGLESAGLAEVLGNDRRKRIYG